ncbi:TetR/AcrR family transcriptional regulator [Halioxenophilus sp. WMMB6]|uniref:TetR/AcrR family transcriptional regulator n=1 Tax=Halioxenophilus sp. WMMB6 TaxID=3073815 RepID=UPI00295EDD19|nr:TetR/AcrR family transcriptional regulator [Halioxenophilus sp. WMMB6]
MRKSTKQATREAILAAARTVLASDGPEALSLSKVANLAGINRGTAYQHFETREDLIKATVAWVSEHLSTKVFGSYVDQDGNLEAIKQRPVYEVIAGLVDFAVENPTLGRIWLYDVLSSDNPSEDLFFRQFKQTTAQLAQSKYSQDNIDVEVLSVIMLAGYFLWPEWVTAHAKTDDERQNMTARMRREVLRLFLHGVLRADEFPQLESLLASEFEKG